LRISALGDLYRTSHASTAAHIAGRLSGYGVTTKVAERRWDAGSKRLSGPSSYI